MESKSLQFNPMWTLHITDWDKYPWVVGELDDEKSVRAFLQLFAGKSKQKQVEETEKKEQIMKDLLSELYQHTLKDDPKFHFFYEPEIIIRFSSKECLEKAQELLQTKKIGFKVYEYPFPQGSKTYGESEAVVVNNFELFLTIFHAHSIAAILMNDEDHFGYMERVIHTMFNPRGITRSDEGKHLIRLALYKCSKSDVQDTLNEF